MNQQEIKELAQVILSMSAEERQLLEDKLSASKKRPEPLTDLDKSSRIAEISQEIQAFEEKYYPLPSHSKPEDNALLSDSYDVVPGLKDASQNLEDTDYSFFKLAPQLEIEGPTDWSANVDRYLYGTAQ